VQDQGKNTSRDSLEWPSKSGSAFSVARADYSCRSGFNQGPSPLNPCLQPANWLYPTGHSKKRQGMPESHAANLTSADVCNGHTRDENIVIVGSPFNGLTILDCMVVQRSYHSFKSHLKCFLARKSQTILIFFLLIKRPNYSFHSIQKA
jgi:hypothetical protein